MSGLFAPVALGWAAVALGTFFVLLRVDAPYGRHLRDGWGPTVPHRVGWVVMEVVSPAALVLVWLQGPTGRDAWTVFFVLLWAAHYANRALIYPLVSRWGGRRMPLAIMGSAVFFNAVNGGLNGWWFGHLADPYPADWGADPRLICGAALFFAGVAVNVHADATLRRLRTPGETGYRIPRGGLYRLVSCPNYLGEIVEWAGFALMTWSPAAATFAVWTAANLVPRAQSHHRWYRRRFEEYPPDRRALIPWLL